MSLAIIMGSLSGILQRPIVAASAVAVASVSTDLHERLKPSKSSDTSSSLEQSTSVTHASKETISTVSHLPVSKLSDLSFVARIRVPIPNIRRTIPNTSQGSFSNSLYSSVASSPVLINLYQSAELAKAPKTSAFVHDLAKPASSSDVLYKWHLPEPSVVDMSGNSECSSAKSRTVVVLLGWLGAKQRHLKRYAEYYTSRGFHVITFTFPMAEILSYQIGGKAEQNVDLLVNHLCDWLEEENGKNLVFHTFSNTGWLT